MVLSLQRIDKKIALMLTVVMVLAAVAYLVPTLANSQVSSLATENSAIGISKPLVYNLVLQYTGSTTLAHAVAALIVSLSAVSSYYAFIKILLASIAFGPWAVLVVGTLGLLLWAAYKTYTGPTLYWR